MSFERGDPKDIQIAKELFNNSFWSINKTVKSTAWIFPLYFQQFSLTCPEETCFQQVGSSSAVVEGTPARLHWDLLTSVRYHQLVSLSLFLKSEKISALLYFVGKGPKYRPFRYFRPVPSANKHEISNHQRACTQTC
jgi:hypothetical protein